MSKRKLRFYSKFLDPEGSLSATTVVLVVVVVVVVLLLLLGVVTRFR